MALLLGGAWYFLSPAYAMSQLQSAAEAGDADELEQRIDFPKVRDSLKAQLRAEIMAEMTKKDADGFQAFGSMFALNLVDAMIDGVITPEGMKAMIERGKFVKQGEAPKADGAEANWTVERRGLDQFRATPTAPNGEKVPSLVFERDGLGWKLVKVDIPPGGLSAD